MCMIFTQGRFTMAAKHHMSIAELYETDLNDLEQCMYHYEKSADYYKGEESKRFEFSLAKHFNVLICALILHIILKYKTT